MDFFKLILNSKSFVEAKVRSHAYLIYGEDSIAANGLMRLVAARLLCQHDEPCLQCVACQTVLNDNHADCVVIKKDKIKVEDIDELMQGVLIKPFGEFKIYLIHNFDTTTPQAQNKLLKTLEEPPENTVFLLAANSLSTVLPTIRSRCAKIAITPFLHNDIKQCFLSEYADDSVLQLATSLSNGSLTKTQDFLQNPQCKQNFDSAITLLTSNKSSQDIPTYAKILSQDRENLIEIFEYVCIVMRDVLCFKNARPQLVLSSGYSKDIVDVAQNYTNSAIVNILQNIPKSLMRLASNGNINSVVDQFLFMLLECKYNCRASV